MTTHTRDIDDVKADIKFIRSDIQTISKKIDSVQSQFANLPYWFTGALFAQGGLIVAILQLLR